MEHCLNPLKIGEWKQAHIIEEKGFFDNYGLFKIEGIYKSAFFRNIKAYRLLHEVDESGRVLNEDQFTRLKGIDSVGANILKTEDIDPRSDQQLVITRFSLRPSSHLQMEILRESRTYTHPFNLQRYQIDHIRSRPF